MKTKFLQSACFAAACVLLSACVEPKAEEQPDGVPQILISHKGRASFTALDRPDISAVKLFNGENFDGWYTFTEKYGKGNDVEGAFTVENGVMRFNGEAMGYLCTNASYKDYYLKVVFRWGDKKYAPRLNDPRDSGVLYHFPESAQDRLWPFQSSAKFRKTTAATIGVLEALTPTRLTKALWRARRSAFCARPITRTQTPNGTQLK